MNTRRQFFQAGAATAAGIAIGVASPLGDTEAAAAEQPTEADIGFCADMTAHHVQALAMCQRVLGRDTGDPVQVAAAEVLQNQAIEVGQMRAWLTDWGQSTAPPTTAMAWMEMPLSMMPGLASTAEMTELSTLTGIAQGRRWLELMRAHHVGGVAMAEAAVELASMAKVVRLATAQSAVQTYEISQYDWLLARDYA